MKRTVSLILLVCFLLNPFVNAQKNIDLKEVNRYFEKMVQDWDIPSASIGIVKDGRIIFVGTYGLMEVGKDDIPNENTLYAIASNSKAFTSAMIGMLVQEGKLNWDDKVKKHLPYFELYDPWVSNNITIRDLLCHRSGLGTFSGDNIWYKSELTAEEIIKRVKHVPQAFDFRSGFGYSNLMYITAGEVIKTVTGKSWDDNVKEMILEPLGMTRTIASIHDLETMGNYATPHMYKDGENQIIPWTDWDNVAATGGLISSINDIMKWMVFNLNHGIIGNDTLLSRQTRNIIWKPHNNHYVDHTKPNNYNRHFNSYGLGWSLSDFHGRMKVSHTGGYDGMITAVTLIPDENLGIVVLTNGTKSPINAATYYALDKFLEINSGKDWSSDFLKGANQSTENNTRISERIKNRVSNTQPTVQPEKFTGDYFSDIYGEISIIQKDNRLKLVFEHSPLLSATLTHWNYDVWQITWDHPQAWFSFGTIKINTNNKLEVTGFDFDVPNNDFFFEELKPYKIKN